MNVNVHSIVQQRVYELLAQNQVYEILALVT